MAMMDHSDGTVEDSSRVKRKETGKGQTRESGRQQAYLYPADAAWPNALPPPASSLHAPADSNLV
jgi:hypothetical protein